MTPGITSAADAAIADYLDDLRDELAGLPRDRRRELVGEIEAHIEDARVELDDPSSEAQVRTLLDRIGSPAAIADEALAGEDTTTAVVAAPAKPAPTWREPAAIVLLLLGGFVAFVGWLVGVVLLWSSPRWTVSDKVIGTFLLPGGLITSALLLLGVVSVGACEGSCDDGAATFGLGSLALLIVMLSPLFTAIWLSLRLQPQPRR